jgi:CheY-like chemotaxis protein
MPGMTGTELVEKLQAMGSKARLVVLTANVQEPLRRRVEALGARFVKKPINEQAIAEILAVLDA